MSAERFAADTTRKIRERLEALEGEIAELQTERQALSRAVKALEPLAGEPAPAPSRTGRPSKEDADSRLRRADKVAHELGEFNGREFARALGMVPSSARNYTQKLLDERLIEIVAGHAPSSPNRRYRYVTDNGTPVTEEVGS